MVMAQIGENPDLKRDSRGTIQHQPLRRDFHYHTVAAFFYHFRKIFLNGIRFRCGIRCRNVFLTDNCLDGSDQSYFMPYGFQNRTDHISRSGLALGSGNSDDFQFFCRITEICCGSQCQSVTGIFHLDHRNSFRYFHLFFHDQCRSSFFRYFFGISMTVGYCAADADKDRTGCCFSGIIDQSLYLCLCRSLYHFIFQTF